MIYEPLPANKSRSCFSYRRNHQRCFSSYGRNQRLCWSSCPRNQRLCWCSYRRNQRLCWSSYRRYQRLGPNVDQVDDIRIVKNASFLDTKRAQIHLKFLGKKKRWINESLCYFFTLFQKFDDAIMVFELAC